MDLSPPSLIPQASAEPSTVGVRRTPGSMIVADSTPGIQPQRRRVRMEDQVLMASARDWLEELPKGVRPIHLPRLFPRICNGIERRWEQAADIDAYLAEKETSHRLERQGFPPLIKEELLAIRVHWMRLRALELRASLTQAGPQLT